MADELTVNYLQKDKNETCTARMKNSNICTLSEMMYMWESLLANVMNSLDANIFTASDKTPRLTQLKNKIKLSSQIVERRGVAFVEGMNLRMSQSPAMIDEKWGSEGTRHIEMMARMRTLFNPYQSPIVEKQMEKHSITITKLPFSKEKIELYDGIKRIEQYKKDQLEVIMTTVSEIEEANVKWITGVWCNPEKIKKMCNQYCRNGFALATYFKADCDLVSLFISHIKK